MYWVKFFFASSEYASHFARCAQKWRDCYMYRVFMIECILYLIHSQFEHDLSHTRANGSGSEEPDSALSDDLTVQRNGQVWSSHDFGSRACTGGFGSCSYWHRWWIGITQSYWHPCNSHETVPCKKGQGLKVRHWLSVNGDSLDQFTGSSF